MHHCMLGYTMSVEPTYSIVDVRSQDVTRNDMHCRFLNGISYHRYAFQMRARCI